MKCAFDSLSSHFLWLPLCRWERAHQGTAECLPGQGWLWIESLCSYATILLCYIVPWNILSGFFRFFLLLSWQLCCIQPWWPLNYLRQQVIVKPLLSHPVLSITLSYPHKSSLTFPSRLNPVLYAAWRDRRFTWRCGDAHWPLREPGRRPWFPGHPLVTGTVIMKWTPVGRRVNEHPPGLWHLECRRENFLRAQSWIETLCFRWAVLIDRERGLDMCSGPG